MVSEMVQNSQSLYSFTFNALFIIHEYIYLHLRMYIYSHSKVYIRSHSQSKYWFNTVPYSFNIFCAPPLRIIRSSSAQKQ